MKKAGFKSKNMLNKFYMGIGCAATVRENYKYKDQLNDLNRAAWLWVHKLQGGRKHWARAFDRGRCFRAITTNQLESLSGVLKCLHGLPITAFVAATYYKVNNYLLKRHKKG